MSTKKVVFLLWMCFVLRAGFHACVTPLWEGFDEYSHFAMIQHVALQNPLPHPQTTNSSEQVRESLTLVPVSTEVAKLGQGFTTHHEYWELPEAERQRLQNRLYRLPAGLATQPADPPLRLYEAQQAPFYYWITAPFYLAIRGLDFPTQVWALRWFTLMVGSLLIPIAYTAFRLVLRNITLAMASTALLALLPELMFMMFRVSNEALAIVAGSLLFLVTLQLADAEPSLRNSGRFAFALAFAFLTKAYFLAIVPAVCLFLIWTIWSHPHNKKAWTQQAAVAVIICALLTGWWYLRSLALTGSFSGEQGIAAAQTAKGQILRDLAMVPWKQQIDFIVNSYIWLANWSFIQTRSWIYRIAEVTILLAVCGLVLQVVRGRTRLAQSKHLWMALLPCATFAAGIAYHAGMSYINAGGTSLGFYSYCLVVPQVLLLTVGLLGLFPARWTRGILASVAFGLAAVELFGVWFLTLPYYAGLTSLILPGRVHVARWSDFQRAGLAQFLERLAANKPHFLTPAVLLSVAILYVLATAALVGIAVRLKQHREE